MIYEVRFVISLHSQKYDSYQVVDALYILILKSTCPHVVNSFNIPLPS